MKIFITGATGFVGRHLTETLKHKNELLTLTRNSAAGLNTVTGSLSDIDAFKSKVKRFKPDAIIHAAWEGIPDYGYAMSEKNLWYGLDMLELCKYAECGTILFTGSCWEYKSPAGKISESNELSYENGFKAAKNCLHKMAEVFCAENNISLYWTRLFYVYGPGQKEASIIPYALKLLKEGKRPEIRTPHNKNDFVNVNTVARAIEAILERKPSNGTINIGSGKATAIIDVLRMISGLMDIEVDFGAYTAPTGNEVSFYADTSILKQLSVFDCSMEEGLRELISP